MPCDPSVFGEIPIFSLLDAEERAVLAEHVELRQFREGDRIYVAGDPGGRAYLLLQGRVQVSIIDDDGRAVVVDAPQYGEIFGLSSMLSESRHLTTAMALDDTTAIEIDRSDIAHLLERKPLAGLDMLTMVGKQFRAAQELVRNRVTRNPNEEIAEVETVGDHISDAVARFGGSWKFISLFIGILVVYTAINLALARPWDPYPFILLNLFLSMLAAFQAPVIMMSQNRQDAKDRLRGELDYRVNLKAEMEISQVLERLNRVEDRIDAALPPGRGGPGR